MAKRTKKVIIEREGTIARDVDEEPWIKRDIATTMANNTPDDRDIAREALSAGYGYGTRIRYQIIIEPKR
jgi:hypothetical protein